VPNALITGSPARASDVAAALRSGGFEPFCADSALNLVDVCAAVLPESLDCYIQLPDDHSARTTAVAEASAMVADGGMARYEAAAHVGPMLAEGATVVLVMGGRSSERERSPGLIGAVNDLTRVLARALRKDHHSTGVRVALMEDGSSPIEIAAVAAERGELAPPLAAFVDVEPGLGFAEWRLELLSLLGSPGGNGPREERTLRTGS